MPEVLYQTSDISLLCPIDLLALDSKLFVGIS
jgi:hypothetical protein